MKNLRSNAPKTESNDDCRLLAPFVMTLFDGEADEIEARRARAHLLICQNCANRWLDWNRSRDLLRSAPVPAPPPQLLWRVLMACRLKLAPQRAASSQSPNQREIPNRQASPIGAPADLSAQIFARTTQTSRASGLHDLGLRASFPPAAPLFRSANAWSPLQRPALAVPALALWMMVLQRDIWLPAPVATPISSLSRAPRRASTAPFPESPHQAQASSRLSSQLASVSTSKPLLTHQLPAKENLSAAETTSAQFVSAAATTAATVRPLSRSRRSEIVSVPNSPLIPILEASFGVQTAFTSTSERSTQAERSAERSSDQNQSSASQMAPIETMTRTPRRAATVRVATVRPSAMRMAALSEEKRAPHLRATGWRKASLSVSWPEANLARDIKETHVFSRESVDTSAPQLLRVSLPSVKAPLPTRLLAENFEADDRRVEEIRSVVDDFRATLGPEDANAESNSSDEDNAN